MNYEKIANDLLDRLFTDAIPRDDVTKIIERACLKAQLELLNEFLLKPVKEFPRCLLEKRDEIEAKLKAMQ